MAGEVSRSASRLFWSVITLILAAFLLVIDCFAAIIPSVYRSAVELFEPFLPPSVVAYIALPPPPPRPKKQGTAAAAAAAATAAAPPAEPKKESSAPAPKIPAAAPPPAAAAPKTETILLLVRHGQSMHNISDVAQYGDAGADATLYDAALSPLGEEQVATLANNPELATAELLLTSPLTRAIQTLFGAFPNAPDGCPAPIEVWPLCAEHVTDSCDIGSGASWLAKRFPSLAPQMRALPEVWWYTDEDTSRVDAEDSRVKYKECGFMEPELDLIHRVRDFVAAVKARPERVIAVFGHSDYFNFVMENHAGISDYWLENAECYRLVLKHDEDEDEDE